MVRNVVVLSGNSHPKFVDSVCNYLGLPPANRVLDKFSSGETRCEIRDSIRGKDVYIIQSFGVGTDGNAVNNNDGCSSATGATGHVTVNDYFIELCIMISACKTGSARRVTAVLPFFPYSRQPDLPYARTGAPLVSRRRESSMTATEGPGGVSYTFESVPSTPAAHIPRTAGLTNGISKLTTGLSNSSITRGIDIRDMVKAPATVTVTGPASDDGNNSLGEKQAQQQKANDKFTTHDYENPTMAMAFQQKAGFKPMMAQAGSLIADLLMCAGADRIVTCDLHESSYQGFFDIPVDNLVAKPILKRYIQHHIENYKEAVVVSPDAGGAKRAATIADSLGLGFALVHKDRRPPSMPPRQNQPNYPTMMLVGNVAGRVCIMVDDLADTGNTITRAAKLLKREGAVQVIALITHGVFSGDAIQRINASALDRVVVTNTVAQDRHLEAFGAAGPGGKKEQVDKNKNDVDPRVICGKLEVLDIAPFFAEAIRRIVFGESVSMLLRDGD
ncbi:phosphoribosyltransferase-like protein [Copromyces sp. CBS 386.78]|nr:phosphoribosyltransferase-like protein [Copromyces sp. CBS 386.78]